MAKIHSFTRLYNSRSRVLEHDIDVCIPDVLGNVVKAKAVWDTGATNTVINQRIVDALGLQPISFTKVHTASQKGVVTPVFLVDIFLKHDVRIVKLKVTRGELEGCDCLLGMDIIALGDFAVTNYSNQTCVSFRIPSQQRIDFVQSSNSGKPIVSTKQPGRNDPCSCGSGKKYKHCHGKNS